VYLPAPSAWNTDQLSKSRDAANVKPANSLYRLLTTLAFAAKLPHLTFFFFRFLCALAKWQNTFLDDASDWILRFYSLKSILPRGLGFGRMAEYFLKWRAKPVQNVQILLRFCRETVPTSAVATRRKLFLPASPGGVETPPYHRKAATRLI
jgi:hypothetical protein